jgi:hypothetical protein
MRYEAWTFREAGRAPRIAPGAGVGERPRLHDVVPLLARLDDVTIDRAVGETVRRLRVTRKKVRRRTRLAVDATGVVQEPQHLLRAADASSRSKTTAVAALVEVGGRGGSGSAVPVVCCRRSRDAARGTIARIYLAVVEAASEQTRIGRCVSVRKRCSVPVVAGRANFSLTGKNVHPYHLCCIDYERVMNGTKFARLSGHRRTPRAQSLILINRTSDRPRRSLCLISPFIIS